MENSIEYELGYIAGFRAGSAKTEEIYKEQYSRALRESL